MLNIALIFPNQLFKNVQFLSLVDTVYLIEEDLFFNQFNFHQQKIIFHRASMQYYKNYLENLGINVLYIEAKNPLSKIENLIQNLSGNLVNEIHFSEIFDEWLMKKIKKSVKKYNLKIKIHPAQDFILNSSEVNAYFEEGKRYFQTDFYVFFRKKYQILLDENSKPMGGKWTFDGENRKKIPTNIGVPLNPSCENNKWIEEAKNYQKTYFENNIGEANLFNYAVTHAQAEKQMNLFFTEKLALFGDYEDAIISNQTFLFHSVLSPYLNSGLLSPKQLLDNVILFAQKNNIPLNSLEGFVRQILGWREFIKVVYQRKGNFQRRHNYWGFTRAIPPSFYNGTTGITPVDDSIKKVLKHAYNHHIERLMILGNFMLLCEFNPDEVYQWFMELYIDAYDWVMVPNVYGMTQFADGGLMTTKPYISGSNYILKMSNYDKNAPWCKIWDALFWRFMHVHRDFFMQNPRLGMLVKTFDKLSDEKKQAHLTIAQNFLDSLDAKRKN
jgi:deoxyribodipyrimidine photolyase-related protein